MNRNIIVFKTTQIIYVNITRVNYQRPYLITINYNNLQIHIATSKLLPLHYRPERRAHRGAPVQWLPRGASPITRINPRPTTTHFGHFAATLCRVPCLRGTARSPSARRSANLFGIWARFFTFIYLAV